MPKYTSFCLFRGMNRDLGVLQEKLFIIMKLLRLLKVMEMMNSRFALLRGYYAVRTHDHAYQFSGLEVKLSHANKGPRFDFRVQNCGYTLG